MMTDSIEAEKIVIVGTGGFAREVAWLISDNQFEKVVGFVTDDTDMHGKTLCDLPVLGTKDWLYSHQEVLALVAIGNPRTRSAVTRELEANNVKFTSVDHNTVQKSKYVEWGKGCIVCAGAILTTQVKIGNHVHINLNVTIGHDVIIGDYVTIAPGANISGNVIIEDGVDIGTNAVVIQGITIGRGAIIGACAAVVKDVEQNAVVVGVPAKPIKKAEPFI